MTFLIISVVAFILTLVLQRKGKRLAFSVTVPIVFFVAFLLFDTYVLTYRSGGASMWPIAILFGAPVVLVGGLLGYSIGRRFWKPRQGGANAF